MQLIVLNTIGLTGVEALQARLSAVEGVLVLPGQNFTLFDQHLYRPHCYTGMTGGEVFEVLSRQLYTKDGRLWMGLTKHMSESMRSRYDATAHQELFLRSLGEGRGFFSCVKKFATSYFELVSPDALANASHLVIYSGNFVLNEACYGDASADVRIWNVSNRIDTWLASISQARTWNCVEACKFWLINNLYLVHFQKTCPLYRSLFWEDVISNPDRVIGDLAQELGAEVIREAAFAEGVLSPSATYESKLLADAQTLRQIYNDEPLFRLADTFDSWSELALEDRQVIDLLEKHARFWNSTAHTNFDWIGLIGEKLIDHIRRYAPASDERNLSLLFYHEFYSIYSDSHNCVEGHLDHYLGDLEKEIVLPLLPYFLKVALEYLDRVAKNYLFHAHSYIPMRRSLIYQTLTEDKAIAALQRCGLTSRLAEIESQIDQAESACAYLSNLGN